MRVAGIMSGTSLDGIDVAIVDIAGKRITTVTHSTTPYSDAVRQRILGASTPADISRLNFELGELYAKAVIKACKRAKIPRRIPRPHRLSRPDHLSRRLCKHSPDRRSLRHRRTPRRPRSLRLPHARHRRWRTGRATSTVRRRTALPQRRGPQHRRHRQHHDSAQRHRVRHRPGQHGDRSARRTLHKRQSNASTATAASQRKGHVNRPLLDSLLADKYYKAKPPKTAGREQYGTPFVDRLVATGLPMEDLIATATALTAATIAAAIPRHKRCHRIRRRHAQSPAHGPARGLSPQLPPHHHRRIRHRSRRQRSHRLRHPRASHMASPHRQSPGRYRSAPARNPGEGHVPVKWTP